MALPGGFFFGSSFEVDNLVIGCDGDAVLMCGYWFCIIDISALVHIDSTLRNSAYLMNTKQIMCGDQCWDGQGNL